MTQYKVTGRIGRVQNIVIVMEKRWWGYKKIAEFISESGFGKAEKYLENLREINTMKKEEKNVNV